MPTWIWSNILLKWIQYCEIRYQEVRVQFYFRSVCDACVWFLCVPRINVVMIIVIVRGSHKVEGRPHHKFLQFLHFCLFQYLWARTEGAICVYLYFSLMLILWVPDCVRKESPCWGLDILRTHETNPWPNLLHTHLFWLYNNT